MHVIMPLWFATEKIREWREKKWAEKRKEEQRRAKKSKEEKEEGKKSGAKKRPHVRCTFLFFVFYNDRKSGSQ